MVRFLVLYDTPNDIGAFEEHYWKVHIPMAKRLPGLLSYAVSRNARPIRGGEPYYLVAELAWENMEALKRAFASPEGKATAADVAEFAPTGVRSMIYELEEV